MTEPRAILVIQLRRIGDVILTTPAVAALKKLFPDAALDFLVEPAGAEALEGNPHIRERIVYDAEGPLGALSWMLKIRARRYDWVIDFMGNPRSAFLTAASGAAVKAGPGHVAHRWAYGIKLPQSGTTQYAALEKIRMLAPLGVPSEDAEFLPSVFLGRGRKAANRIAVAPASRRVTRRWPARHYIELGKMLRRRFGAEIVVLWGPGERPLADAIAGAIGEGASAPETRSLTEAAEQLASCRLLVSNCAGPKHLAVALGVPTVTVHSSSDPAAWNPPHPRHLVVRRDELFCIGCGLNACPYKLECVEELAPERVFLAAEKLLS